MNTLNVQYGYHTKRGKYTAKVEWLDSNGIARKTVYKYSHNEESLKRTVNKLIEANG